jgi:hypothetical protein
MKKRIAAAIATGTIMAGAAAAIVPAGASADNGVGPNCANGQFTAAYNQTSLGGFFTHLYYAISCIEGTPPGQSK